MFENFKVADKAIARVMPIIGVVVWYFHDRETRVVAAIQGKRVQGHFNPALIQGVH